MRQPGANHVDRRRKLAPARYIAPFGCAEARAVMPEGGDMASARIAALEHRLVLAWRAAGRRPTEAELARKWSISKQTISRSMLGDRWMGETVMSALIDALQSGPGGRDGAQRAQVSRRKR